MSTLYELVKSEIEQTRTTVLSFNGELGSIKRRGACLQQFSNCKYGFYSEPLLIIKFKNLPENTIIDTSKILENIIIEVGGHKWDTLYRDQINIYQHKYNIKPSFIENTAIIPLPFNCLLKENGVLLFRGSYEVRLIVETTDYVYNNNIEDSEIVINFSQLKDDFDMSKITNCFYNQMIQTKAHQDSLLKINGKYPSDYVTYCLTKQLMGPITLGFEHIPNVKNLISNTEVNTNTDNKVEVCQTKGESLDVSIGLISIKQNQFIGLETVLPKSHYLRFKVYFNHDVESMYIHLNLGSDIYVQKWFDRCTLQVNGVSVLECDYATLVHCSKPMNLPNGVLSLPNVKYVKFSPENVCLCFSGISLPTELQDNFTFSMCAESSNYATIGECPKIVFE